jgi:hypothetical protein
MNAGVSASHRIPRPPALGDHSLFDEGVVFFGSEISHPPQHIHADDSRDDFENG